MSGFTSQRNWLHTLLYRRRRSGLVTGAMLLLAAESQGLALDFAGSRASGPSAQIKDTGTPANNYTSQGRVSNGALVGPGGKLTYASPSPKLCLQSDGTYKYQAHNLYLNSAAPANQSITVRSGESYTIILTGSVSITLSGATTGTVTAGSTVFTAASGTLTCGSTSGSGTVHVRLTNSNTDYIATTSAAIYDLPYEYDTSGNPLGIRVEEARTNLALRAQEFDNASWTKANFTITANAVVAPDGNTTADQLTATAGGNQLFQLPTLADSSNYTGSFYVKKSVGNWVYILFRDKANVINTAWFNIGTGAKGSTAGTISAYTIDALSNSWYRISATFNSATGAASPLFFFGTATGDTVANGTAGDSVYLWQAQLELGSFATSPIVTAGSTVTRAADNISLETSLFPYAAASSGTVYASVGACDVTVSGAVTVALEIRDAGSNNRVVLYSLNISTNLQLKKAFIATGGATQANIDVGTISAASSAKWAMAYATNDVAGVINGGTVGTDITASMPSPTTAYIGSSGSANSFNGYIKQIMYLPRRMSNAEIQSVTT